MLSKYHDFMIDPHRLEMLTTLAREKTLAATAKRLHLSQSTVSHHLNRLQAETKAVLLTQVGRSLQLTAEGQYLAQRGAAILADLDQLERELQAITNLASGTVKLVAFPSAVPTLLPPVLAEVARRAPGLRIEVADAEPPTAAEMLHAREADVALAFRYPNTPQATNLTCLDIGPDPLYLVTAKPAATAKPESITVPELAAFRDDTWIAGCNRCSGHLVAACHEAGFSPTLGYTSDDYVAVQSLVAAGHGITLLPGLALSAHRNPGVTATRLRSHSRTLQACTEGQPPHTPAIELLLHTLHDIGSRVLRDIQNSNSHAATPT